jgi:hypothetical protein
MYATNAGGAWRFETVDAHPGGNFNDLNILPADDGAVHAVYTKGQLYDNHKLIYATNASGSWTSYLLDRSWEAKALAGPDGLIHLVYTAEETIYRAALEPVPAAATGRP